jgi:hypothetical protein
VDGWRLFYAVESRAEEDDQVASSNGNKSNPCLCLNSIFHSYLYSHSYLFPHFHLHLFDCICSSFFSLPLSSLLSSCLLFFLSVLFPTSALPYLPLSFLMPFFVSFGLALLSHSLSEFFSPLYFPCSRGKTMVWFRLYSSLYFFARALFSCLFHIFDEDGMPKIWCSIRWDSEVSICSD